MDRFTGPTSGENDVISEEYRGQKTSERKTSFEEIMERILGSAERVTKTASGLETIGTRVLGALPEQDPGANAAVRADPDGTLDRTFLSLNRLDASIARLEAASLRLELI